jgi:hypothetical protein
VTGCLRRAGCAVLLLVLGAAAWHWRGLWLPKAKQLITADLPGAEVEGWQPLTRAGAQRTVERVQRLRSPTGPAFVNVAAADFASYVLGAALTRLAEVDSAPMAIVHEGELWLRTLIRLSDLGGRESLGPLSPLVGDVEPLTIAGRLEPVRHGLAQYRLTEVALRDLKVPGLAVSRLITRWGPPVRAAGVANDALPIELPPFVADIRLVNGRVTLYKAAVP